MTVVRGVRDRRFQFTQVLNSMLEDENLSLKGKGFITYCLSKPPTWKFHMSYLKAKLKEGESAIYSVISECIEQGYAIRYQTRNENGGFGEWETIISDSKHEIEEIKKELKDDPDFKKSLPHRGFPDAVNSDAENSPHSNIKATKEICKKQQAAIAAAPAAAEKLPPYSKIEATNARGEKISISESEVFQHFLKFPYPTSLILEAIARVKEAPSPVNNILKLLESICERLAKKPESSVKHSSKDKKPSSAPPKCTAKGVIGLQIDLTPVIPKISRFQ